MHPLDIEVKAQELMQKHNLTDWTFRFDNAKRRGGLCNYRKKEISLSIGFCNKASYDEIVNVCLHEIAHALVGPGHHHNAVWRAKAKEIGCTAERCHRVEFTEPKYIIRCNACKTEFKRHRMNARLRHRLSTNKGTCRRCHQSDWTIYEQT